MVLPKPCFSVGVLMFHLVNIQCCSIPNPYSYQVISLMNKCKSCWIAKLLFCHSISTVYRIAPLTLIKHSVWLSEGFGWILFHLSLMPHGFPHNGICLLPPSFTSWEILVVALTSAKKTLYFLCIRNMLLFSKERFLPTNKSWFCWQTMTN